MATSREVTNEWYYRLLGEEFGPVSRHVLDSLIAAGQIGDSDEVREADAGSWRTVAQILSPTNGTARATDGTTFSLESLSDAGFDALDNHASQQQEGWFYRSLGSEWGPFSFDELLDHARQGDIAPDDDIRMGRNGKWRRAGSMGRLMAVMPYAVREAKTIPTGVKPGEDTNNDFETRVPMRDVPPPAREPAAPPPSASPPTPPPPPPPPAYAPPPPTIIQMPPQPMYGMPTYMGAPAAPWGYGQQAPAAPMNDQGWYAWLDGVECGPMDFQQMANWGKSGRVSPNDYVKQGKYSQWSVAKTIPGLVPVNAPPPAPPPVAVAPAPVAAPAAKPALQLPPPAKTAPAAAAPTPAPILRTPTPPLDRPTMAPDAPPEKKWNDEWSSSSVRSTCNPALAAAAAAKKSAPTPKSRGKKRSGGGDFDVGALLKDVRVLGALGVVALGALIYVGLMFMPEGTGKLVAAHKALTGIHKEIEGKSGSMPTGKDLESYAKSIKAKTKKVGDTLTKSKHAAKSSLTSAISNLNSAAGQKTADDVKKKLEEATKKLDDAKKKLKI